MVWETQRSIKSITANGRLDKYLRSTTIKCTLSSGRGTINARKNSKKCDIVLRAKRGRIWVRYRINLLWRCDTRPSIPSRGIYKKVRACRNGKLTCFPAGLQSSSQAIGRLALPISQAKWLNAFRKTHHPRYWFEPTSSPKIFSFSTVDAHLGHLILRIFWQKRTSKARSHMPRLATSPGPVTGFHTIRLFVNFKYAALSVPC